MRLLPKTSRKRGKKGRRDREKEAWAKI